MLSLLQLMIHRHLCTISPVILRYSTYSTLIRPRLFLNVITTISCLISHYASLLNSLLYLLIWNYVTFLYIFFFALLQNLGRLLWFLNLRHLIGLFIVCLNGYTNKGNLWFCLVYKLLTIYSISNTEFWLFYFFHLVFI
jgi:hypothetical protein